MKLMFPSKCCASFIFEINEKLHQPVQGAKDAVKYAVPHTVVLEHESLYKGASSFHDVRKNIKELSTNDTSRYPKVVKIAPNHGCQ